MRKQPPQGARTMQCTRFVSAVSCALWLAIALPAVHAAASDLPKVAVTIGPKAADLERYAADQLCDGLFRNPVFH